MANVLRPRENALIGGVIGGTGILSSFELVDTSVVTGLRLFCADSQSGDPLGIEDRVLGIRMGR